MGRKKLPHPLPPPWFLNMPSCVYQDSHPNFDQYRSSTLPKNFTFQLQKSQKNLIINYWWTGYPTFLISDIQSYILPTTGNIFDIWPNIWRIVRPDIRSRYRVSTRISGKLDIRSIPRINLIRRINCRFIVYPMRLLVFCDFLIFPKTHLLLLLLYFLHTCCWMVVGLSANKYYFRS